MVKLEVPKGMVAKRYSRLGWAVVPLHSWLPDGGCSCGDAACNRPGTHPSTPNGVKEASGDPTTAAQQLERQPAANVGVATGTPSGLAVLEVRVRDGEEDVEKLLQELETELGSLPETVTAVTPFGGRQFYFRCPQGGLSSSHGESGWLGLSNIVLLADDEYVVVPPSVDAAGYRYTWMEGRSPDDMELTDLPQWLCDPVGCPSSVRPEQGHESPSQPERVGEEHRHRHLSSIGAKLRAADAQREELLDVLHAVNDARCDPPLEHLELEGIVDGLIRCAPSTNTADTGERLSAAELEQHLAGIEWLWRDWIPQGAVTLLAGKPGVGKSVVALWLCKLVTEGLPWPDGQQNPHGERPVIWCEAEGSMAANLERMRAFSISPSMIHLPLQDWLADFRLDQDAHLRELARAVETYRPSLIVVDSLSGSHGRGENAVKVQEPLIRLRNLASTYNCAVLVLHHVRKTRHSGPHAEVHLADVRGSSSLAAVPRSVILLDVPQHELDGRVRLRVVKSNFARAREALMFEWVNAEDGQQWLEFSEPPQAVYSHRGRTKQAEAMEFLQKLLKDGQKMPLRTIKALAEEEGFSFETLKKASELLGVIKDVHGPKGSTWRLPNGNAAAS